MADLLGDPVRIHLEQAENQLNFWIQTNPQPQLNGPIEAILLHVRSAAKHLADQKTALKPKAKKSRLW